MNTKEIIQMMGEKDPSIRIFAARKISELRIEDPEELIEISRYLNDSNEEIRSLLTEFFKKNIASVIVPYIVKQLEIETIPKIRANLYKALANSMEPKVFPVIHHGLNEPDVHVKVSVIEALSLFPQKKIDNIITPFLLSENARIRNAAYYTLYKSGIKTIPTSLLTDYHNITITKDKIPFLNTMGKIHEMIFIPTLKAALTDLDIDIRMTAAKSLGEYSHTNELINFLVERFFEEKSISVLNALTNTLYKSKNEAVEVIMHYPLEKLDSISKANLARALGVLITPNSLNILIKLLDDLDSRVRANTIESLGKYRDNSYLVNLILPYLRDDNHRVKAAAASILWKMGILNAMQTLKNMLNTTNELVQKSAAFVLSTLSIF